MQINTHRVEGDGEWKGGRKKTDESYEGPDTYTCNWNVAFTIEDWRTGSWLIFAPTKCAVARWASARRDCKPLHDQDRCLLKLAKRH
jgi:hypothetical protein